LEARASPPFMVRSCLQFPGYFFLFPWSSPLLVSPCVRPFARPSFSLFIQFAFPLRPGPAALAGCLFCPPVLLCETFVSIFVSTRASKFRITRTHFPLHSWPCCAKAVVFGAQPRLALKPRLFASLCHVDLVEYISPIRKRWVRRTFHLVAPSPANIPVLSRFFPSVFPPHWFDVAISFIFASG